MSNPFERLVETSKDVSDDKQKNIAEALTSEGDRIIFEQAKILNKKDDKILKNNNDKMKLIKAAFDIDDNLNVPDIPKNEEETVFVNIYDFIVSYLSKMYAMSTTPSAKRIWLNDWWNYPMVVGRLNALWVSWEKSYKDNTLASWFLRDGDPMMQSLMDKETGFLNHFRNEENEVEIGPGEPLVTEEPPSTWFNASAKQVNSQARLKLRQDERLRQREELRKGNLDEE